MRVIHFIVIQGLYSLPIGRNKRNVGLLPSGSFHKQRQDLNLKINTSLVFCVNGMEKVYFLHSEKME